MHDTLTITGYMCVWYTSNLICIMHCRSIQCNCFTQSSGWQLPPTQLLVICKLMATVGRRGFCTPVHSFLADSVVHVLIRMVLLGQISASNPFYVPQDIDHYYSGRAWVSPKYKSNNCSEFAVFMYICLYVALHCPRVQSACTIFAFVASKHYFLSFESGLFYILFCSSILWNGIVFLHNLWGMGWVPHNASGSHWLL